MVAERQHRLRRLPAPAETYRTETGAEFVRRFKNHFISPGYRSTNDEYSTKTHRYSPRVIEMQHGSSEWLVSANLGI